MFGKDSLCVAQKKEYCKRLGTREGYGLMAASVPEGAEALPATARRTRLRIAGSMTRRCAASAAADAVAAADFAFVSKLCAPDVARNSARRRRAPRSSTTCLRIAPPRSSSFIATNCAGRKYSSQIDARYRDLCWNEMKNLKLGNDGSGVPANPAEAVETGVKEGVKGLKKVFGF